MRFGKRRQRREEDLMGGTDTEGEGQSAPPLGHASSNSSLDSDNDSATSQDTTPRRSKK